MVTSFVIVPGALLILVAVILLGLLGLKVISAVMNAMLGHRQSQPESGGAGTLLGTFLVFGCLAAIVMAISGVFLLRTRAARVAHEVALAERDALQAAARRAAAEQQHAMLHVAREMNQLSQARQEIQDAVAETRSRIEVELRDAAEAGDSGVHGTTVSVNSPGESSPGPVDSISASGQVVETSDVAGDLPPELPSAGVAPPPVLVAPAAPDAVVSSSVEGSGQESGQAESEVGVSNAATESAVSESTDAGNAQDGINQENATADSGATAQAGNADSIDARRQQLSALATTIGQLVNSQLRQNHANGPAGEAADGAAKNDEVLVFQVSEEMMEQLLGDSGRELLKSFNDELPGSIRQTYALVPLTPPVGSSIGPVKPLIPGGRLETIASSLISLVEIAERKSAGSGDGKGSVVLAAEPELRPMPDWVQHPDGRRIVAETRPIVEDEDAEAPLTDAINMALTEHLKAVSNDLPPLLKLHQSSVHLELSPKFARSCVVETWERTDELESAVDGDHKFRKIYALLEFPESVDREAVSAVRRSVQANRITGLGFVVGFAWMTVVFSGWGIRLWRRGRAMPRVAAVPVFAGLAVPSLASAVVLAVAMSRGYRVEVPWQEPDVAIRIGVTDEA